MLRNPLKNPTISDSIQTIKTGRNLNNNNTW